MTKRITIFGGSQPQPGDPDYESAYNLGCFLGQEGYTVLTGGYIGTMEAVSRAVAETGGRVIGVTCDEIEAWRHGGPNKWIHDEIRSIKLIDRLMILVEKCDAAIALPGGIGTLTEISLMWTLLMIKALPRKPIILVGCGWRNTFDSFYREQAIYLDKESLKLFDFAPDVDAAFRLLQYKLL